jgi:hypothetical protein
MGYAKDGLVVNAVSDRDGRFAANLAVVQDYLVRWKSSVDIKGIYVIGPSGRTFDSIAFSILNKAYRLSQACIILLEAGYSDEAFGLARSLIECSLNLRYMTMDPEKADSRSNDYVDFAFCEKKHFLELCRQYFGPGKDLDAVEALNSQEGIEGRWASIVPHRVRVRNLPLNDWKLIEGDWNGWKISSEPHPLDDQINKDRWIKKQFAADYRGCSAMVHCTIRSLDNIFAWPGVAYKVGENLKTWFDHRFEPLFIIVNSLYLVARYTFYGANVDEADCFDSLFNDAVSKLVYVRQS